VRLTVSGTVIGVIESALRRQTLELGGARRATSRHGAPHRR
jgi:hypothetical protein